MNLRNIILTLGFLIGFIGYTQELEPRAINNLPIGTNFIVASYAYNKGDILMDPALPVEGLNTRLNSLGIAYVRSINFFGLSGKFDIIVPSVYGDWEGDVEGSQDEVTLNGLGDIRVRFSFNYLNSPAMDPAEFVKYKRDAISGLSFQLIIPTGNYRPEKLINIGSNRWVFKPQWGYAKYMDKWIFETYASIWFFLKNDDYLDGNELKQKPLFTGKVHVIRKLPKNMWVSANIGYGYGGRVYVNDEEKNSIISAARFGFDFSAPIGVKHTLKLGVITGVRFQKGNDFDGVTLSYIYRWNNSMKKYLQNKNINN